MNEYKTLALAFLNLEACYMYCTEVAQDFKGTSFLKADESSNRAN